MKITYYGHSCFLLEFGGEKVIVDPFISDNPHTVMKPEELEVAAILLTHGHSDHVGDAVNIAKRCDCPIIANYEIAQYLNAKEDVKVEPMHIGGTLSAPWGKVKMTLAFHGSGLELGAGKFEYGGLPAGLLIRMGDRTFYHAGDTALFGDMKIIGELNHIDVAALPIGDRFTMGPEDALIAATWLKSDCYIPMHYNTMPAIQQDPHKWVKELSNRMLRGVVLESGQSISIE